MTTSLQPVSKSGRIPSMDILRGFALLGIAVVNILGFNASFYDFGGFYSRLSDPAEYSFYAGLIELTADKFIFLFSLLFGYGLQLQQKRLKLSGYSYVSFEWKRMGVLAIFGVLHIVLLWAGDILLLYAIAGIVITGMRNWRSSWIIIMAAIMYFFIIIWLALGSFVTLPDGLSSACPSCLNEALANYGSAGYWPLLLLRIKEYIAFLPVNTLYYLPKVLGITAAGYVMARYNIISRLADSRYLKWIVVLITGTLGFLALRYYGFLSELLQFQDDQLNLMSGMGFYELMNIFMALAYASLIIAIGSTDWGSWLLSPFGYAGRMSLTNYLLQSLIFGATFYGWGMGFFGSQEPSRIEIIAIMVFIGQLVMSYLWLSRFSQGPLEYLWRKISYQRISSIRY